MHFINVGQGDAILILAPGGYVGLIDGGYGGMGTLAYLRAHGVTRVNLMVATHPHADHIGGLVNVLRALPVDEVVTNGVCVHDAGVRGLHRRHHGLQSGLSRGASGRHADPRPADVRGAEPGHGRPAGDVNNGSIVLRLAYGPTSFLFTGDAQACGGAGDDRGGLPLQATILKVGHHGSATSSSLAFLQQVQPQVAIYSAGIDNPYGHPHASTLANLARVGAQVYGTDVNGTVLVAANGQGYTVWTEAGNGPRAPPGSATATPSPAPGGAAGRGSAGPVSRVPVAPAPPMTGTPRPGASGLPLAVVAQTAPARRNGTATLVLHTQPGAIGTIDVSYKSGSSQAAGLAPQVADAGGQVAWSWMVGGQTTPGTGRIVVTARAGGATATTAIPLEVLR